MTDGEEVRRAAACARQPNRPPVLWICAVDGGCRLPRRRELRLRTDLQAVDPQGGGEVGRSRR
jgi:hypothetical protein